MLQEHAEQQPESCGQANAAVPCPCTPTPPPVPCPPCLSLGLPGSLSPPSLLAVQVSSKATAKACGQLEQAVEGYGLEEDELAEVELKVGEAARQQLLTHAREAANTVLSRVKDRWAAEQRARGYAAWWAQPSAVPRVAVTPESKAAWTCVHGRPDSRLLAALQGVVNLNAHRRPFCLPSLLLPPAARRFNEVFQRDEHGMPRTWQPSVDIAAVTGSGRRAAALLLSQLCFVRSGPTSPETAAAEASVLRLADDAAAGPGPGSRAGGGGMLRSRSAASEASTFDLLSATEWPGVAEADVLLAPGQARSIWRQFMSDSTFSVQQVRQPSCL